MKCGKRLHGTKNKELKKIHSNSLTELSFPCADGLLKRIHFRLYNDPRTFEGRDHSVQDKTPEYTPGRTEERFPLKKQLMNSKS